MCETPNIFNGYEASCRECDQCLATYKNSWVSRCCAELVTTPHALAFTLTYADIDGKPPLGARVIRYKDVQDFWRRIRKAGKKRWGKDFSLRYVAVAEKGTKFLRVHYHGVLFSNYPVQLLGTISSNEKKEDAFTYKRRLHWSLWAKNRKPIGFVEFQPADRKGIAYTLKYILKSRMTAERSARYKRLGKTEYMASSTLFCSKVPGIGHAWLFEKLDKLYAVGMCPPSLRMKVPGAGDWYVMGETQKRMMLFIREANATYKEFYGTNLGGYASLVASVEKDMILETGEVVKRKAWEYLIHGDPLETIEEKQYGEVTDEQINIADGGYNVEERAKLFSELYETSPRARRCFGLEACADCRNNKPIEPTDDYTWYNQQWLEVFEEERSRHRFESEKFPDFSDWIVRQGLVAQGCKYRAQYGSQALRESRRFKFASARFSRLQREAR